MKKSLLIVTCICVAIVFSCKKKDTTTTPPNNNNNNSTKFAIHSPSFADGGLIPVKYTVDVQKPVFPPLQWVNAPSGAKSFLLIMDDPDSRTITKFGHATTNWCVFNIQDTCTTINEGVNLFYSLPPGSAIANNELGQAQYGPPSPPGVEVHNYSIRLYAVDGVFTLTNGCSRDQVWKAVQGHLLDSAKMTAHYY